MWSVVHFPFALINNLTPIKFSLSQGWNGESSCRRSEFSFITTLTEEPFS